MATRTDPIVIVSAARTPIGGLLLLVGWACAAAWAIASPRSSAPR